MSLQFWKNSPAQNNGCSWYFDVPVKQMIMKKDVNVITVIFFTTVVFNKQ